MTGAYIEGENARMAWSQAVQYLLGRVPHEAHNLVVRILRPIEVDHGFARFLDAALASSGPDTVRAVARTIMPRAVAAAANWRQATERIAPRLPRNSYFRRMTGLEEAGLPNQLSNVIDAFARRRPDGGLWVEPGPVVLTRPGHDAPARVGFPCLSQVQFHRSGDLIAASATYRSHDYDTKAYGNFVGLGRLQRLVANELGLGVGELLVVSTQARLSRVRVMRSVVGGGSLAA